MVTINGKLIDSRHLELSEPVPPGEDTVQVRLLGPVNEEVDNISLLTCNPSFDFLRDELELYP